jgi:hypothetical protein
MIPFWHDPRVHRGFFYDFFFCLRRQAENALKAMRPMDGSTFMTGFSRACADLLFLAFNSLPISVANSFTASEPIFHHARQLSAPNSRIIYCGCSLRRQGNRAVVLFSCEDGANPGGYTNEGIQGRLFAGKRNNPRRQRVAKYRETQLTA